MNLGPATWPELAAAASPVVVLPLGSCEQHGPHLPIDTDTRIAVALAARLATGRPELLVAPPLAFGASWEHHGFPGLLSLDGELLADVLVEVARSADWSTGVVLVNGHGGNLQGVREAVRRITSEERRVLSWWPRIADGDAHAGRTETSLMLALHPELVRLDRAVPGWTGDLGAIREHGVRAVSDGGVLGDPTGASAAEGDALLDSLTADLATHYDEWRRAAP
jgi:creatinine amidohydrolase